MTVGDLDDIAALLGDPRVMTYYPAPKTRYESTGWIAWTRRNYAEHGYGLWVLETHDAQFVGDCGLTWQCVNGEQRLEVGYHVRAEMQGRGLATEAAIACRDFARDHYGRQSWSRSSTPATSDPVGVAEKVGMTHLEDHRSGDVLCAIYCARF